MVDKKFIGLDKPDITRFESYLPTAFSSELTLLQKVNKIIQDLNRSFDLTNEMVDYLNRFIETFDEKLYETLEDVLTVWLEDGRLADVVRVAINDEVIEARTDYLGKKYVDLKERLDSEKAESLLKVNEIEADIAEVTTQLTQIAYYVKPSATADEMQNILTEAVNNSTIMLAKGVTYAFDKPIMFGLTQSNIRIDGRGSTVKFNHNGDGFVLESQNENYGGHTLENMNIVGPNIAYPTEGYNQPSNGAGIKMIKSYYAVIRDCRISQFNMGVYIHQGIKNNFEGSTYIRFNEYGVYIEGGATNVNNFKGISIRENRKKGVHFKNNTAPYPSHNIFQGCLIESNIPYPNIDGGNAPTDSIGVHLNSAYDNKFVDCYFENHQYAICIDNSSDGNSFINCRFNQSADGTRNDGILLKGDGLTNNTFINCNNSSVTGSVNVNADGNIATLFKNQCIDCSGFVFSDIAKPKFDLFNIKTNQSNKGDIFGALSIPRYGQLNNPSEGVTTGKISGIGTTNAILNASGYGEVILGSLITAPTTITNITGLKTGQVFVLSNHQIANAVTIKSSTDGINGIVLKDKKDVVLSKYSDTITFYVTSLSRVVEIGRNISEQTKTTINSSPSYVGEVMVIDQKIYIAFATSYGAWKELTTV